MTFNNTGNEEGLTSPLDTTGKGNESTTTRSSSVDRQTLPVEVTKVSDDVLTNFSHTKRVGNYLLGRTIGEGSFAKVKEGLHTFTGELVSRIQLSGSSFGAINRPRVVPQLHKTQINFQQFTTNDVRRNLVQLIRT